MVDKIRIKRTEGSDPPAELDFGEMAFIEGLEQVVVGKSDGSQLPIGSTDPADFAPVAFSGAYADLTGKPSLFSGAFADLSGIPSAFPPVAHTQDWSTITGKPTFASVATSGSYNDLSDRPSITGGYDLLPADGVTVTTNKLFHNGTGYKQVYRRRFTWDGLYPDGSAFFERPHGIAGIELVTDYALFFRNSGYLYRVAFNEIAAGRSEAAVCSLTDCGWNSAKNRRTDGTTGAYFLIEYILTADGYITP